MLFISGQGRHLDACKPLAKWLFCYLLALLLNHGKSLFPEESLLGSRKGKWFNEVSFGCAILNERQTSQWYQESTCLICLHQHETAVGGRAVNTNFRGQHQHNPLLQWIPGWASKHNRLKLIIQTTLSAFRQKSITNSSKGVLGAPRVSTLSYKYSPLLISNKCPRIKCHRIKTLLIQIPIQES